MLLFDKVQKKYNENITALDDVNFQVDQGEFFFLVGPSGAGKTTLMRLLIREEVPTAGSIFFRDIDVPHIPNKLLPTYRQKLGIVFQDIKLLETKTLQENIAFALEILGKNDKEIKDTTEYLLELVGLQDRRNLFPIQLSGGEQQRGAIARALANNPELFIADEPTGNLDQDNALQVLDILKKINKGGTTVMVISHDKNLIEAGNTRTITMEKGKIVADSKKGNKKKEEKVIEEKADNNTNEFKTLSSDIQKIFDKAKINTIEMIFNLTDTDLNNLKFSKEQKTELEDFAKNYLSKKKND